MTKLTPLTLAVLSLALPTTAGAHKRPHRSACIRETRHLVRCPVMVRKVPVAQPVPVPSTTSAPAVPSTETPPPAEPAAAEVECPTRAQVEAFLDEHTLAEIAAGVSFDVECPA